MRELENESIDVIITSPPYNRGKTYSSDRGEQFNDSKELDEYLSLLKRVWKECLRVSKSTSVFFLNIGDSASDQGISEKVALSVEEVGWIRIQDIVWIKSFLGKGHYTPSGGTKRLNNLWEHVYLFVKNKNQYELDPKEIGIPYADKSNIGRYSNIDLRDAGNIWLIPYEKTTGATIKKGHDAPFPIGLPYKCIKLVPNVEKVLDPFGGTCSTLGACVKLGIKGIAYEKYPRIDVIKERINEGVLYKEEDIILIPHLELTVKLLSDLLSKLSYVPQKIKTKKKFNELQILKDILENLNLNNAFKRNLKVRINQYLQNQEEENSKKNKFIQKTL
ncbi:MAG: DNA-methyltransferase [Promethearchaeota archaeon]